MPRLTIALALSGLFVVSLPAGADLIRIIGGNLNFDGGDPPGFHFALAVAPCFSGANLALGVTILAGGGPLSDRSRIRTVLRSCPPRQCSSSRPPDVPLVGQENGFWIESPFQATG